MKFVKLLLQRTITIARGVGRYCLPALIGRGPWGNVAVWLTATLLAWSAYFVYNRLWDGAFPQARSFAPYQVDDYYLALNDSRNWLSASADVNAIPLQRPPAKNRTTVANQTESSPPNTNVVHDRINAELVEMPVLVVPGTGTEAVYDLLPDDLRAMKKMVFDAARSNPLGPPQTATDDTARLDAMLPKNVCQRVRVEYKKNIEEKTSQPDVKPSSTPDAKAPQAPAAPPPAKPDGKVEAPPTKSPAADETQEPHPQRQVLALAIAFARYWEYLADLPHEELAPHHLQTTGLPIRPSVVAVAYADIPDNLRPMFVKVAQRLYEFSVVWSTNTYPTPNELKTWLKHFDELEQYCKHADFNNAVAAITNLRHAQLARMSQPLLLMNELRRRPLALPPGDADTARLALMFADKPNDAQNSWRTLELRFDKKLGWLAVYGVVFHDLSKRQRYAIQTRPRPLLRRYGNAWTGLQPVAVLTTERQLASGFFRETEAIAKAGLNLDLVAPDNTARVEAFFAQVLVQHFGLPPQEKHDPFETMEQWTEWPRRLNGGNPWGMVQFITVTAFFVIVLLLGDQWYRGYWQANYLIDPTEPSPLRAKITHADLHQARARYHERYPELGEDYWQAEWPLLALAERRLSRQHAVRTVAADLAELRDAAGRGSAAVRYALGAIPNLGFLGTVIGIATAMGKMSLTTGGNEQRQQAIQLMSTDLAIAFDTTFVALTLSLVALFVTLLVSLQEERWFQAARRAMDAVHPRPATSP